LDAENKRLDAYAEAENIIIRAKNESFFEYNEIIELAQKNSEIIKNDALKLADEYKKQIEVKNNEKILDLTLFATSKLLKAKLSKKDNEKFVSKFISDIKKEKKEK
jgi:F0F1-type ATP synthase membrane subunit b/b'